jgi:hypothetical protein
MWFRGVRNVGRQNDQCRQDGHADGTDGHADGTD